jgi:hypothetical protein
MPWQQWQEMNMKPRISILNRAFTYTPSYATAVAETWRRFGWRPVKRNAQEQQGQPHLLGQPLPTWRSERATYNRGSA